MTYFLDLSDERNIYVKQLLEKNNEKTEIFNFDNTSQINIGDSIIFSPAKKFSAEEINKLPNNITIFAGNSLNQYLDILKEKHITFINIMEDEIFTIKNANLTCEGVLSLMIEKSKKSLFDNSVLILGGGRIAKGMAVLLGKLGVNFAMVSFNPVKFPDYYIYSKKCYFKYSFVDDLDKYDIIINTIPSKILDDEIVAKIANDTVFIETASVDCLDKSKATHFDFIPAPALPKKYTCETAGKFLFEMITGGNIYD